MPGYRTSQTRIGIAGAEDLLIRSLLDGEQFFDPLGVAERLGISSAAWPMFGLLWPSGLQLAARMARRPLVAGERILEIGCGLAVASLVCHRRGADITASDCHPLAGDFLRKNLLLNHLAPMKYRHGHWGAVALHTESAAGSGRESVTGDYDLIVGSDLLYERDADGDLAGFIGRHAGTSTEVWIVDPDRGNRAAFNRRMAALGFGLREERLDIPASTGVAAYKGRLLIYRRPGPTSH